MDSVHMRKLKVGYWPLSPTLTSAGDRRRLVFWARARGHIIVTDLDQSVDVIVASENADFNSSHFSRKHTPVVFDLIDAYLSPLNNFDDLTRGIAKHMIGQISGGIKPFSQHVMDFCLKSNAIICSSIEQEEVIKRYNTNTHTILDSHDEIPLINPGKSGISKTKHHRILWEGQPATIQGVKIISNALSELSKSTSFNLDFVTDEKYFQFLGKYIQRSTLKLLRRNLGTVFESVNLVPWSSENLAESAKASTVAMIPIDLSVPMQRLKPENRLLIMWRLGLPCLTSPSPAYTRVAHKAQVDAVCESPEQWLAKFKELLENPKFAYEEVLRGQNYLSDMHSRKTLLHKWDHAIESVLG